MGRLEKVGAAVVGVLLCIIIVVGLLNKNERREGPADASRESAVIKPGGGEAGRPANEVTIEDILVLNEKKRRDEESRKAAAKPKPEADPAQDKPGPGGEIVEGPVVKEQPKPAVEPVTSAWPKEHEIKSGEILGKICVDVYGTTSMVPAVLAANPGLDPRRLRSGAKIKLPAPPAEKAAATGDETPAVVGTTKPASRWSFITPRHLKANNGEKLVSAKGGRLYTVKKGDTLGGIAAKEMGSSRHVQAIVDANKKLLPSAKTPLQIGWQLEIPNLN